MSSPENPEDKPRAYKQILVLESERAKVDEVVEKVEKQLLDLGWTSDEIGGFDVAISEAMANAIVHGNHDDKSKKVTVEIDLGEREATVSVANEGGGFDVSAVMDPTADENILKTSGRGIFLMRQYCDTVEFLDGGKKAVLTKRR